ncbi:tol-pal system YbgF family protein, partial [Elusimicrobiota bacterium]
IGDINYYKYNDLDNALRYYRITANNFPEHSLSQVSLYKSGEILRKIKQWEEAIKIYDDFVNRFKTSSYRDDAYYYIGECYHNMGRLRHAKNSYYLVLGDFPNSKWNDVIYNKLQSINKILKGI